MPMIIKSKSKLGYEALKSTYTDRIIGYKEISILKDNEKEVEIKFTNHLAVENVMKKLGSVFIKDFAEKKIIEQYRMNGYKITNKDINIEVV